MKSYLKFIVILVVGCICSQAQAVRHLVQKVPSLTLEGAKVIAVAAAEEAKANDWNLVIAICDVPIIAVSNIIALEGGAQIEVDGYAIGGLGVSGVKGSDDGQSGHRCFFGETIE